MPLHRWLRGFVSLDASDRLAELRTPRPGTRLRVEPLEDRVVPAVNITIIPGAAGTGDQDANLLADGQILFADPDAGANTLTTGALAAVGATTDILVQALGPITFDLGGTLTLG